MADAPVLLTRQTARRLAIAKQHLAGKKPKNPGRGSIMSLMRDIRYVQIDPTSVVAPSHLLVLRSRLGAIKLSDLDRLQWREKKLFEYWAHRASIVLTEDYPLYQLRMKGFATADALWPMRLREWMKENSELREYTLNEIRARGPLSSRDFEDKSESRWKHARRKWGLRESGWSTGKDASKMLEFFVSPRGNSRRGPPGEAEAMGSPGKCPSRLDPEDRTVFRRNRVPRCPTVVEGPGGCDAQADLLAFPHREIPQPERNSGFARIRW